MIRGTWLGFVFFVALVILGFATLIIGDLDLLFRKSQDLDIHFAAVQGLRKGDDVRVDGLLHGKVQRIDLDPLAGVIVTVRLKPPVEKLYDDAEIHVESSSVLGGSYVSIRRGTREPARDLTRRLTGRSRPGLEEIGELASENRENFRQLVANLKDVTQALREGRGSIGKALNTDELHRELVTTLQKAQETITEVKRVGESISKTAETVNQAAVKLEKGEGPIGALLNDKQMTEKINRTLDNVEKSSDNLKKITDKVDGGQGTLSALLNDRDMADRLKKTVENIERASDSIKNITGKIERGEGTLGKFTQDDQLYEKAKGAIEDLNKFIGRAGRSVLEVSGDSTYYEESEIQISKLGIRLNLGADRTFKAGDLEDKYFYLGAAFLSLSKEGKILFENLVEDNEDDTEIKPEVLVSYRVPWFLDRRLSVRGGLIEGKPGGGADLLWDDWLLLRHPVQLSFEIRDSYNDLDDEDIDEQLDGPLLRFYLKAPIWTGKDTWWEVLLSTLRVTAGVSRVGEEPEYLVGIGLQWPDDDLRTLVSLLGLAQ